MISKITDDQVELAQTVLDNHTVDPLNREGALESGLFCICSQATPFEIASKFVYRLREKSRPDDIDSRFKYSTIGVLTNPDIVNEASREVGWRFAKGRRFDSFINYFGSIDGEWWPGVRDADFDHRAQLIKDVKWISEKTLDFWMLCLGRNSIALDVHVMKHLRVLGLNISEEYIVPQRRKTSSQLVRRTPNKREYARIESDARELFSQDERFLLQSGDVNMALVDAALWWEGADRGNQDQRYLFGTGDGSYLIMPYAEIH